MTGVKGVSSRLPSLVTMTKVTAMKLTNLILSLIIIIASGILCQQIISNSLSNQQNKNDYAELNSVKYGLLSIDEWKRQVTEILAEEINKLYLSKANERVLRKHIEVLLNTLIDDVDKKIREGERRYGRRASHAILYKYFCQSGRN